MGDAAATGSNLAWRPQTASSVSCSRAALNGASSPGGGGGALLGASLGGLRASLSESKLNGNVCNLTWADMAQYILASRESVQASRLGWGGGRSAPPCPPPRAARPIARDGGGVTSKPSA